MFHFRRNNIFTVSEQYQILPVIIVSAVFPPKYITSSIVTCVPNFDSSQDQILFIAKSNPHKMSESTNSQELSNKGKSFTPFSKLPLELVLNIWELAVPGPRVVVFQHPREATQTPLSMVSTTYDSRKEILKHYKPCFSSWLRPGHPLVYFNPKDKVIFSNLRLLRSFLSDVTRADGEQIRFMAFTPSSFSTPQNGMLCTMNATGYNDCVMWSLYCVLHAIETLGKVEEITFIAPRFAKDEENESVVKTLEKFIGVMEILIKQHLDPADWMFNDIPKVPRISLLQGRFDSDGLEAVKDALSKHRLGKKPK